MKYLIQLLTFSLLFELNGQEVEINGNLLLPDAPLLSQAKHLMVLNSNNVFEKSSLSQYGSLPSTSIILSATANNTNLTNGFTHLGKVKYDEYLKGSPTNVYGKWDSITSINSPKSRIRAICLWTGNEMIAWGGFSNAGGGKYNPSTNVWTGISSTMAPTATDYCSAVWDGMNMIVWGGIVPGSGPPTNTGSKYNPTSNTWTPISTTNAPSGRMDHTAVWTGNDMIIWGGYNGGNGSYFNDGFIYNPTSNAWTAISTTNAPSARRAHYAVWTGSEMIVLGGYNNSGTQSNGFKYNPVSNSWTQISSVNSPPDYFGAFFIDNKIWVLSFHPSNGKMIFHNYNPSTDAWYAGSVSDYPLLYNITNVVTNNEIFIWGGDNITQVFDKGNKYNIFSNTWTLCSELNVPPATNYAKGVWTGNKIILWGPWSCCNNNNSNGFTHDPNIEGFGSKVNSISHLFQKN